MMCDLNLLSQPDRRPAAILPALFLGALAAALATIDSRAAATTNDASAVLSLARQLNQAFIEVADKVSPSVVVIRVARKPGADLAVEDHPFFEMLPEQFRERFRKQQEERRKKLEREPPSRREPIFDGQGSGVVIREEGYILTNRHVVEDAEKIKVILKDGAEFEAEVRGVDAQSDMAVIRINPKGKKLTAAKLGDSDRVRVGEFAIAIGAPFELDYSVTFGHVSAKGRSHIVPDPAMDQDFIQTDANINPGNSGGPLVNIEGEVIGIATLIRGLRTGIGFAVPANLAREVSEQLITNGRFVRAWLGIGIGALKDQPEYRSLVNGLTEGVVVKEVLTNGPAAKSDLKPSDVITAVDGHPVATAQQLKNEIRSKTIGQSVTLDVHRMGKKIKVKVVPEVWPDEPATTLATRAPVEDDSVEVFGLTVKPLTRELAQEYDAGKTVGVIVTEVEQDSVAASKGLRPGDIITDVNHKAVTSVKEFRDVMKTVDTRKGVIFNFTSRGTSKFEILKEAAE